MAAIDWNLISIIVFYSIIAVYFYTKRKSVETQFNVIFLYKTKKFNVVMEKIANCCPRFWKWFGYASIPVGFTGMIFIVSYLAYALVKLFLVPSAAPSVSLVVPGVHIAGFTANLPFWYGIIALFFVIVVHEGAHGIVLAAHKLRIKSSGVGMALFLPLAFVEPDEKQLEKQKVTTQLSVFAAGAFSNFVNAGIVFLIAMLLAPVAASVITPSGAYFETITADKPAALAGIQSGDVIIGADNVKILQASDLEKYMLAVTPGQTITLKTAEKEYTVNTIQNPNNASRAYIGIEFKQDIAVRPDLKAKFGNLPFGLYYLLRLFYWIFALNIGIGIINLLPLGPIDGGRMAKAALHAKVQKKNAMKLFTILTYVSLFLLLANIIMPYFVKAFA